MPKRRLIAIVDDDEDVRESIRDLLRSHGYAAVAFASAEEFLQSNVVSDTACLVADIQMPGMGGLDLHARLIADGHRMPVIFITGSLNEERTQAHVLEFGAIGVLVKPCKEQSLIEAVEKAFAVAAAASK
jgi:FixJ family two-component response regulator